MYNKSSVTKAFNKIQEVERITTVDMAKKLNTSRPSFIKLLNGDSYPSLDLLVKFLNAFPNINLEWMFCGKGEHYMTQGEILDQKDRRINELLSLSNDKSTLIKLLQDTIAAYKDRLEMLEKKLTK